MMLPVRFLGRVVDRPRITSAFLAVDLTDCIMGEGRPRLYSAAILSFHFQCGTFLGPGRRKLE